MSERLTETSEEILRRYSAESASGASLSCGGALGRAKIQPGETVVDLGCGRGKDVIKAARTARYAWGVDLTPAMLDEARKNAAAENVTNAEFILCPIDRLSLGDRIADVVISNCAINHAPDKAKVFSEIFRILRPGGRFVISDIVSDSELPPEISGDPAAVAACYGGAVTFDKYLDTIKNAGFQSIEILEESKPYERGGVILKSLTLRSEKKMRDALP